MTTYQSIKATVDGKPYLAVLVNNITYLIWTVARDTGCNITNTAPGDVEIDGYKPPQVFDGNNTFIQWTSIPSINPNPKYTFGFVQFTTRIGFAGNSSYPILDLNAPEIKSWVYTKTNLGGWFFDALLQATHTSTLTITEHPVQLGSSVSDFAFLQPRKISMNIGMSDVAHSFIPGQFEGGWSRSVEAYKVLQKFQQLRIPIQVLTRLGLYQNMLVESLTVQDDHTTLRGLRCTVNLQELLVATVKVVKISSNPAVTDNSTKGTQQPKGLPPSLLSLIGGFINGK